MDSTNGSMSTISEILKILTVKVSYLPLVICTISAFYSLGFYNYSQYYIWTFFWESDTFVSEAPLLKVSRGVARIFNVPTTCSRPSIEMVGFVTVPTTCSRPSIEMVAFFTVPTKLKLS